MKSIKAILNLTAHLAVFAVLMCLSALPVAAQTEADQILGRLLAPPEEGRAYPQQVHSGLPIAYFFLTQKAINHFPYGANQEAIVSQNMIKSIVLDVYRLDARGNPGPTRHSGISITFDRNGVVESISPTRGASYQYTYDDGRLVSISQNNVEVWHWDVEDETLIYASPADRRTVSLNGNGRTESYQVNGGDIAVTFLEGEDGFVNRVLRRGRCGGGREPISTAEFSLSYIGGNWPPTTNRLNVTGGGRPFFTKYCPEEHVYSQEGNWHFQRQPVYNFGSGQEIASFTFGYELVEGQIQRLLTSTGPNTSPSSDVGWSDGTPQSVVDEGNRHGYGIGHSDSGLLTLSFLGSRVPFFEGHMAPIRGVYDKQPGPNNAPRFIAADGNNRSYLALNPIFTEYYVP